MATPQSLITVLDLHGCNFSVHSNLQQSNVKSESLLKISFETKCINQKILNIQFRFYQLTQIEKASLAVSPLVFRLGIRLACFYIVLCR